MTVTIDIEDNNTVTARDGKGDPINVPENMKGALLRWMESLEPPEPKADDGMKGP